MFVWLLSAIHLFPSSQAALLNQHNSVTPADTMRAVARALGLTGPSTPRAAAQPNASCVGLSVREVWSGSYGGIGDGRGLGPAEGLVTGGVWVLQRDR